MSNKQSARVYTERYHHPRTTWDGPFGNRPFFIVSVEVQPEKLAEFNRWYEEQYLPRNLADVPTWVSCRRYTSYSGSPARQLTIYEAENEAAINRSLELMRAKWRLKENDSWLQWDSGVNPIITWEDANTFIPIYLYKR